MKKITALSVLLALMANITVFAQFNTLKSSDGNYEYTDGGVITSYYGEENVIVPTEIDGIQIREIGVMAFFDLDIFNVHIEEGIEEINTNAFEGSNVTYAKIPSSVKTVGERAFSNCSKLSEIALNSDSIEFDSDVFMGTNFIQFDVPCTVNEDIIRKKISNAKGDNNFELKKIHTALKTDIAQNDIFYCEDCGLKVNDGTGDEVLPFEDVVKDEWYFPYIYIAYSFGILNGKSENTFEPNAGMTCAEAVKIAACIHEYMTDYRIDTDSGSTWYEPYFQHCCNTGIIDDYIYLEPNKEITRAQMAYLFARCDVQPYEINPDVPLTDIPDVHDTTAFAYEILELYRRGIAVGSDEYMNFYPDAQVKRSEAAAFISRILCTDMRIGLPKG